MNRFDNKVVLVTGAASGIGYATTCEFAKEGALVVATDLRQEKLDSVFQDLIAEGYKIETRCQDVTEHETRKETIDGIVQRHGHLDVLFNNAGGSPVVPFEATTPEQWRFINSLNLDSVFFGMQAAIEVMKNQEKGGVIINNSSIAALIGFPLLPAYAATKGGIRSLTKAVAIDVARKGLPIRVNSIHPGTIMTPWLTGFLEGLGDQAEHVKKQMEEKIPMNRCADPIEVARPVLFLASNDASYITGAELVIDGGQSVE